MKPTSASRWVVSVLGLLCTSDVAQGTPVQGRDVVRTISPDGPLLNESSLTTLLATRDDSGGHVLDKRNKPFALRILPLGASIVYGYMSPQGNGFRKYLRDQLRYDGWEVNMVGSQRNGQFADNDVEATSGFTIEQVKNLARNSYHYKPNVVVIHVGTNDVRGNVDIPNFGLRMRAFIDSLFEQPGFDKATIVVSTLIGILEPQFDTARASANIQLRSEVARYQNLGKAVVLAEMVPDGTDFVRAGTDYADLIHPNDSGCKRMAAVFWQAIRSAEFRGYLKAADPTDAALGSRGGTCDKLPGRGQFAGTTQKGSGWEDGVYSHSSQSMGVVATITSDWDRGQWFLARLFTKDRHDIVGWYNISATQNRFGTWQNTGATTNTFVRMGNDLNTVEMCLPRGIRFHDLNGDGLDDFICVGPEGGAFAAINNGDGSNTHPPTFTSIGRIRSPMSGYDQSRVRFGDLDGDGRADFCLLEISGDMRCWRNGGWGNAPAYWQPMGTRFTGKGMGDLRGVNFVDINGDGRDDWLWVSDTGAVTTWTNSRSCVRGREGDGLNIVWRAATNNPSHGGMGTSGVRDRIHFGRVFSDPVDLGLQRKADYIFLEHSDLPDGRHEFKVKVWKNLGSGATKIKADGNKYCNMKGHTNGRQDYVWTYNRGAMVLYPNKGSLYVSDTQSFWDGAVTIWDPVTQAIGRPLHRRDLHLMDFDGDGVCDIVWTDPESNYKMSVWRNRYKETGQWLWDYLPNPAPGVTCDQKSGLGFHDLAVRFADITGNGKDDYICLEKDGRAKGYVHNDQGDWDWIDQYKFSEGKDRANLRFHDVNGDGRADLIWTDKWNGDGYVWYNRGRRDISGSRFEWGQVGNGKAFDGHVAGACTYYADLDGNNRWDLHEVTHSLDNTANTWFNVCGSGDGGGDDAEGVHDPGLPTPPGGVPGTGGSGPGGAGNVCTAGSGFGLWYELCVFACKYAYCLEPCTCDNTGPAIPLPNRLSGAIGLSKQGPQYENLCGFSCEHGTCPSSTCGVSQNSIYMNTTAPLNQCRLKASGKWACMAGTDVCRYVTDDNRNDDAESWNHVQANDMIPEAHNMWKNFRDDDPWSAGWLGTHDDFLRAMVRIWGGEGSSGSPRSPQEWDCRTIGSTKCYYEVPCGRTQLVALDLVLRAMMNVHHYYARTYAMWTNSRSEVSGIAEELSEDFGPDENKDKALDIFMTVFKVITSIVPLVHAQAFKKAGEMITGGAGPLNEVYAVISKEVEDGAKAKVENAGKELGKVVEAYVDSSRLAADLSVKFLFGGSDDGLEQLNNLMRDGAFLSNWTNAQMSDYDLSERSEKVLKLKLIPDAWRSDEAIRPFLLYTNGATTTFPVSSRGFLEDEHKTGARHQYHASDGNWYTFWMIGRRRAYAQPSFWFLPLSNYHALSTGLSGGDAELYEKYGVTWRQIAESSFEGWLKNGKKNNYPQSEPDEDIADPGEEPWRIPGFYNLPVCNWAHVWQNRTEGTCDWDPCCGTPAS